VPERAFEVCAQLGQRFGRSWVFVHLTHYKWPQRWNLRQSVSGRSISGRRNCEGRRAKNRLNSAGLSLGSGQARGRPLLHWISERLRHARHAEVLDCAVDYSLEFVGVFDLAAFGEHRSCSVGFKPGWVAVVFLGLAVWRTSMRKALTTYSCTPPGCQKTPLEWT